MHNDGVHNMYPSQNIMNIISRRVRWAGQAADTGGTSKEVQNFGLKNLNGRGHSQNTRVEAEYNVKIVDPMY